MIILGNTKPVFIIAGNPQEANNWTHRYLRYVSSREILEGHHDPVVILVGSYYARKDYDSLQDLIIANTRKSQENKEVKPSASANTSSPKLLCKKCGSDRILEYEKGQFEPGYECLKCGYTWKK